MRIVVINLARSIDRRRFMESNLGRLGLTFEFFTGIDALRGEHLGISRYDESTAGRDFFRPLSSGEVGCFASHYLLWQRCVEAKEPFVVLEDDAVLEDGFVGALQTASSLLRTYPLLRLGLTREAPGSSPVLQLPNGMEVVSLAPESYGMQCYVLSCAAAQTLLERAEVWTLPVDIFVDRPAMTGLPNCGLRPYFVKHAGSTCYPSVIGDHRYEIQTPEARIRSQVERFLAHHRLN